MNSVFPETPGFSGAFLQGWRRRPGSGVAPDNAEEVYAVIVKQAWIVSPDADPAVGTVAPDPDGPEVFEEDQMTNLLRNADFADAGLHWSEPANADVAFGEGEVTLTSTAGAEDLSQVISFGTELRDRRLGASAKAAAANTPAAPVLRLELGADTLESEAGLTIDPDIVLGTSALIAANSNEVQMTAAFPSLAVDGEALTYSELVVQHLQYESDLVPYKPEADIIVAARSGPVPLEVRVNGATRFEQPAAGAVLSGLGWEHKVDSPREAEAGDMGGLGVPPPHLPQDFENSYFNGYRRGAALPVAQAYLQPGDRIVVTRDGVDDYGFALPDAFPELTHKWFTGTGKDDPCLWRSRAVALNLDTLVIEPDRDRAYAVWRACWAIDDPLGGFGPIPADQNREALVTLEGAA
ncbi:DUF2169 domain-containing protein [Thalassococcus sp. BH17M4-6]|uniref:DUF2169 domain-containing protein n=1 Tax=Thalassococcus sp. BH17M4-6 TaxID=3413148 RepID=UPI003BDB0528